MIKFVILSTQHSGFTLLQSSLSTHSQIQGYGELFQELNSEFFDRSDFPEHYTIADEKYQKPPLIKDLFHKYWRKKLIYLYLSQIYSNPKDKNVTALGFKFMYSQATLFPEAVDWLKKSKVKVIHLIRHNLLQTLVSVQVAKQHKNFLLNNPLKNCKIRLKIEKLRAELTRRAQQIESYRNSFKNNLYLEVAYESFVISKDSETKRLLEFLALDQSLTLPLATAIPISLKNNIENYEEVVRELKGTQFEHFLE